MYNNINIKNNNGDTFTYLIEYNPGDVLSVVKNLGYSVGSVINFNTSNVEKYGGLWMIEDKEYVNDYIPQKYNTSYIRIYFPQYSMDTYHKSFYYVLTLNTWMGERQVNLGTFLINRLNTFAVTNPIHMYDNLYYEYVEFEIVDPYYMMYSKDWKDFRDNIFMNDKNFFNVGSISSILNVSLYPAEKIDNIYIPCQHYSCGRNNFKLTDNQDSHFNLKLKCNIHEYLNDLEPAFICELGFNKNYESLDKYFEDVYGLDNFLIQYELTIGNSNELCGDYKSKLINSGQNIQTYTFTKSLFNEFSNEWKFPFAINWNEGIYAIASINIYNTEGETLLYLLSNKIPITKHIYSFFSGDGDNYFSANNYKINSVNLNNINMYQYNINAVNKIEQKVIKMPKPENSKANMNIPVFFSTRELSNLVIHPRVTENICINLDAYKSKVETFTLQINDCQFHEIGRTKKGVLFKITGELLNAFSNASVKEGIYYILNQDSELVTSGKYTYLT